MEACSNDKLLGGKWIEPVSVVMWIEPVNIGLWVGPVKVGV